MSRDYRPLPLQFQRLAPEEQARRGELLLSKSAQRRSVRFFSDDPVPRALIETAIAVANTAPSGANRQPWHFVAVSDPRLKREIRIAAENEEKAFYEGRGGEAWLDSLLHIGTDWRKPFLETVPWIVIVFKEVHGHEDDGSKRANYYVAESVGIACGLFIAAIHEMGLATLTHTPQPMRFLSQLLERPANEKPFIMFPIGYPTSDCTVPELDKKTLDEVSTWCD